MEKKSTKNYYDLTNKELKVFGKEFLKTPGGKRICTVAWAVFLLMALLFIDTLIDIFYASTWGGVIGTYDIQIVVIVFLIIAIIIELYYYLNFYKWLEKKHNIKRW